MAAANKLLSSAQRTDLLTMLQNRFEKNKPRHQTIKWEAVKEAIEDKPGKLWSLNEMERTGGEPDVVGYDKNARQFVFYDCSVESPAGRRSLCYDQEAWESRKENKPKGSAVALANAMGIDLLTEEQYRKLQTLGTFDAKTSSWIKTPVNIRKLGGAIFGDYRYGNVFVYHNGAESYYAARGFRGVLYV
jgi:hypothetical protein